MITWEAAHSESRDAHAMDIRLTHSGKRAGRGWTRVTRGAHRLSSAQDPFLAELRSWAAVLPPQASFTHISAARALGLWLPPLPASVPTVIHLPPGVARPQRPGLRVIRTDPLASPLMVDGVKIAGIADVLLSLCRDLSALDALVVVDSALHTRLVEWHVLDELSGVRRRGAPHLRRTLRVTDGRSESAWETVLRELHRCVGASVTPQFEVFGEDGSFVARGDLRLDGVKVLHEYDGSHHLDVDRQRQDLRRARRLIAAGWTRRGYTSHDLLFRAAAVLRDVDASLGRTHESSRLMRWHAMIRASAFTPAGRAALSERIHHSPRT